jgi:hypothetical protein
MNKVVLTQELRAILGDVTSPLQIYDESGRVVLYVTPAKSSHYDGEEIDLSEEELARRESEGGRPLQEFLAELQAKHS